MRQGLEWLRRLRKPWRVTQTNVSIVYPGNRGVLSGISPILEEYDIIRRHSLLIDVEVCGRNRMDRGHSHLTRSKSSEGPEKKIINQGQGACGTARFNGTLWCQTSLEK